jgi:AbiTii
MLLDEIIALLSDQGGSLEAALLKTKVLLRQIGHKELVPWVNSELAGYPDVTELPPYRTVTSQPHGHMVSYAWQVKDWVLPTGHLTPEQKSVVRETKITSSIGTIEQHVRMYREKGLGRMALS